MYYLFNFLCFAGHQIVECDDDKPPALPEKVRMRQKQSKNKGKVEMMIVNENADSLRISQENYSTLSQTIIENGLVNEKKKNMSLINSSISNFTG